MQNRHIRLLAIDDNMDNLLTLKAVVSDVLPGTAIFSATTGEKGIELARAEDPDVILLDIVMPGMDGYEVCRSLKRDHRLQHIPVLFLTALKTTRDIRMKALESGAEGFLTKPFDETELIAQILSMAKIKTANVQLFHDKERLAQLVAERTKEMETELSMRRRAERDLLMLNFDLKQSQTALLKVLEDLKAENTERRKAELEAEKAKEEALAANASKSQFLANMSHELRTPMNGVMGMLQLLEMTPLTEAQLEYVRLSKTSSDALLVVINGILDYSRIETGKMNLERIPFNLGSLVSDVVGLFSLSASNKAVELASSIHEGVPALLVGDPFRLRQVLSNLIGNAVKFTSAGQISVSVTASDVLNSLEIKLEFVIQDTGVGIPADKMGFLFKHFSQVDNSNTRKYGGAGLGLAISKGLVEMMGGEIRVDSTVGEGSRFSFTCILEKVGMEKAVAGPPAVNQALPGGDRVLKLLLAEDDAVGRRIVEQYAKRKGWEVTSVEHGQMAVDTFMKQRFDAILMDIQMPVLDGYAATGVIRRLESGKGGRTPIIAMTAYALSGDREKCMAAGMDDYLPKPLDMAAFYEVVEQWSGKEISTISETDA